jgi:addiction module RelE/StbE family toxin
MEANAPLPLRWTHRALADLQRLADRIVADGKPQAAAEFVQTVQAKAAQLQNQPWLGRASPLGDCRELVLHRHYLLTYRVRGQEVQVLQLWHVARDRTR